MIPKNKSARRARTSQPEQRVAGRGDAERYPIEEHPANYRWLDDGEGDPPWPGRVPVEELVSDHAVWAARAAFEQARSDDDSGPGADVALRTALVAAAPDIAATALLLWAQFFGIEAERWQRETRRESDTNGETALHHRREGFKLGMIVAFQNLYHHGRRLLPEEAEQ